jgi:hypothetical protein
MRPRQRFDQRGLSVINVPSRSDNYTFALDGHGELQFVSVGYGMPCPFASPESGESTWRF